jgi:hypothetical protein
MLPRACCLVLALALVAGCNSSNCDTITADVGELCLPLTVAPDSELVIELREMCGRRCSHTPSCTAFTRNGQVVLDVQQEICGDAYYGQCTVEQCIQRVIRCRLPALRAGDYPLVAPGSPVQLLRVREGGQASCRFPAAADGGT